MAFTEVYHLPQLWEEFSFYYTTTANNGAVSESVAPGRRFKIGEIRAHLSVAFASVEDLVVRLSATQGSAYNITLTSQAMNAVQNLQYYPSYSTVFLSDDELVITFSMKSGTNVLGLNVIGWAVSTKG